MKHEKSFEVWKQSKDQLIYPSQPIKHPYYISAPKYRYSSAGIRALYLLCHSLNRLGFDAFITNQPWSEYKAPWTTAELKAPMLTNQIAKYHFENGVTPIVLYPETITGNPLKAPVVARWVLNFPGLLGGDKTYATDEIIFGFSSELASAGGNPEGVLHMPTVDTRIFHPSEEEIERNGCCYYADKFKNCHKANPHPITSDCFEITRGQPDSPSPSQIADILRKSKVFYTYENTALATEAVLCGCPAVFIPNPYLTKMIASEELGTEGYAWGTDPAEIERATSTVAQGAANYLRTYNAYWEQLDKFIAITQERASQTAYPAQIRIPGWETGLLMVQAGWRRQVTRLRKEYRRLFRRVFGEPITLPSE